MKDEKNTDARRESPVKRKCRNIIILFVLALYVFAGVALIGAFLLVVGNLFLFAIEGEIPLNVQAFIRIFYVVMTGVLALLLANYFTK